MKLNIFGHTFTIEVEDKKSFDKVDECSNKKQNKKCSHESWVDGGPNCASCLEEYKKDFTAYLKRQGI
jgi:hypothetical protein